MEMTNEQIFTLINELKYDLCSWNINLTNYSNRNRR